MDSNYTPAENTRNDHKNDHSSNENKEIVEWVQQDMSDLANSYTHPDFIVPGC